MAIERARYTNCSAHVAWLCALGAWLLPTLAFAPALAFDPFAQRAPDRTDRKDLRAPAALRAGQEREYVTLHWMHGPARLPLDERSPSQARFDELLADRVTGEIKPLAPQLLAALRQLAMHFAGGRFELVSGYRSAKFNEMLRKKGRNVASSSQHSEARALDVRIWPRDAEEPVDPFELERLLRHELHWPGGIGVYPSKTDRFVHLDVGKKRRWISN